MIDRAPKIKMMKEYGRHLRLDDEAEKKLLAGASACKWRKRTLGLFHDIVILMRDTGMRNQRELYRMRIENLDWENRVIFVPESVPYQHLSSGLLQVRIKEALSPGMRQRAEVLGRLMREEKRVQNAVARFEQLLGPRRSKATVLKTYLASTPALKGKDAKSEEAGEHTNSSSPESARNSRTN